jgi:hypothetical protein
MIYRLIKVLTPIGLSLHLAACSESPSPNLTSQPAPAASSLVEAPVMRIDVKDVVNTFVLGGIHTDLQRETMTAKLVGATVIWQFKVDEVAREDGRYRVTSELMKGSTPGAFGKFALVAFVSPKNETDVQALMQLQTGSKVQIRGRVDSISMRTALVLSPAELIN